MDKKITTGIKEGIRKKEFLVANGNPLDEITRLKAKIKKLEDENQKLRKYQGKIHDIEQALSESEIRYDTLLKSSKNIIMKIHKGVIVYSNPSGLRVLGYSHVNELKGKSFYDILDPLNFDFFFSRLPGFRHKKL